MRCLDAADGIVHAAISDKAITSAAPSVQTCIACDWHAEPGLPGFPKVGVMWDDAGGDPVFNKMRARNMSLSACGMPLAVTRKLLDSLVSVHRPLLLLFEGDSFARNTYQSLLEQTIPQAMFTGFATKANYHRPSVFCCRAVVHGRLLRCRVTFHEHHSAATARLVRKRFEEGHVVCSVFIWDPFLEHGLTTWQDEGVLPAMYVRNSGLHLSNPASKYASTFERWTRSVADAWAASAGQQPHWSPCVFFLLTTHNPMHAWEREQQYNDAARAVTARYAHELPPCFSLIDSAGLAGIDADGVPHKFELRTQTDIHYQREYFVWSLELILNAAVVHLPFCT